MSLVAVAVMALQVSALITQARSEPVVVAEQKTLRYTGEITSDGVSRVESLLAAHPDIRILEINSTGGSIDRGIDLGLLVFRHGLDVHVTGSMCMSSCANYVFTAGRRKVIEPGAVVVWHGSAIQKGLFAFKNADISFIPDEFRRGPNWLERLYARLYSRWKWSQLARSVKRRQAEFFKLIRVDPEVTVFGQTHGCKCQWTLSPEDMTAFGIKNVSAYPGYGTQEGHAIYTEWKLLQVRDSSAAGQH